MVNSIAWATFGMENLELRQYWGECILAAILNRTKTWGSSLAVLWWCSPCGLVAVAVVLLAVVVIVNLVVLAGAVVAVLQHGLRIYAGTG